MTQKKSLIHQ